MIISLGRIAQQGVLKVDEVEAVKIAKRMDLIELDDRVSGSPKVQLVWGVPSLQSSASIGTGLWI